MNIILKEILVPVYHQLTLLCVLQVYETMERIK